MTSFTPFAYEKMRRHSLLPLLVLFGLLSGCSTSPVRCTSPVDNPAHHYRRGMEALDERHVDFAADRFDRAVYCNNRYSPGYSGLALVMAEQWRAQAADGHRAISVQMVRDKLDLANKHADTPVDQFQYHLAQLRSAMLLQGQGWLNDAEDSFAAASKLQIDARQLLYYEGKEAVDYFMGLAYVEARELPKARDRFAAVLTAGPDGMWHDAAERAWKKVDKAVRALDGFSSGEVGTRIALQDAISRSDLAALLIDELKLDAALSAGSETAPPVMTYDGPIPADILSHRFRKEILTILKLNVRGLGAKVEEPTGTCLFAPDEDVSRGELALILDDVVTKLTMRRQHDLSFAKQGRTSFPDVPPTSPYFLAVHNLTTHGIMKEEASGEFRIHDVVDGAEAIWAMRMVKQVLNIH